MRLEPPTMLTIPLFLLACGTLTRADAPPAPPAPPPGAPAHQGPPGQGGRAEIPNITPTAYVMNGADKLAVYVFTPAVGSAPWPTLVIVPGGFQTGLQTLPPPRQAPYLETGFALVLFDPDGRGQSTGVEDRGGAVQQAGLAAVIDWASKDSRVDPTRMGLVSYSFGITMATGTLATNQTPIQFLLDWEGPANRNYTHDCNGVVSNVAKNAAEEKEWGDCTDDAWWAAREASTSIAKVRVPYQRLQFERDHAQPNHQHTLDMMTAAEAGGVPWVRLNDEPANKRIASDADFVPISNKKPMHLVVEHYAKQMMEMTTKKPVVGNEPAMVERP